MKRHLPYRQVFKSNCSEYLTNYADTKHFKKASRTKKLKSKKIEQMHILLFLHTLHANIMILIPSHFLLLYYFSIKKPMVYYDY